VTSGTAGTLTTTVKASADGSYRYKFAGTSTTGAATATGDYVDVKQPRTGPPPTHSKSPPPQTNSSAAGATSRVRGSPRRGCGPPAQVTTLLPRGRFLLTPPRPAAYRPPTNRKLS
jgi:hypothetical protein